MRLTHLVDNVNTAKPLPGTPGNVTRFTSRCAPPYSRGRRGQGSGSVKSPSNRERRLESVRFGTICGLLIACFLFGGASRTDVLSLVVLHPLAVLCMGIFLSFGPRVRWEAMAVPLLLLGALASSMVVQLIPLPPVLWTNLPGHAQFAANAAVAGLELPWRPISLSPDLTLDSLVSLCVPFAVLVGLASLPPNTGRAVLHVIVAGIALSAFVGLAQLAGGGRGPLYFYDVTNHGSPVGLFANRNHQAVLLALAWPMLAVWVGMGQRRDVMSVRDGGVARLLAAGGLALLILPLILATGSRAGLILLVPSMVAAVFILPRSTVAQIPRKWRLAGAAIALVALVTTVAAAMLLSRDEALERAGATTLSEETRLSYVPPVLEIVKAFFPVGTGWGTFDPVFRVYEPESILSPTYLNHAHNDLLELVMTGGIAALAVLIVFLVWIASAALRTIRKGAAGTSRRFACLGLAMIVILLAASVVDYPLRTPLMAALLATACGWICDHLAQFRAELTDGAPDNALPAGSP